MVWAIKREAKRGGGRASGLKPGAEGGVVEDDGLGAFGAGGDEADFDADFAGEKFDVGAGVGGEVFEARDAFGGGAPAGEGGVDGFDAA